MRRMKISPQQVMHLTLPLGKKNRNNQIIHRQKSDSNCLQKVKSQNWQSRSQVAARIIRQQSIGQNKRIQNQRRRKPKTKQNKRRKRNKRHKSTRTSITSLMIKRRNCNMMPSTQLLLKSILVNLEMMVRRLQPLMNWQVGMSFQLMQATGRMGQTIQNSWLRWRIEQMIMRRKLRNKG